MYPRILSFFIFKEKGLLLSGPGVDEANHGAHSKVVGGAVPERTSLGICFSFIYLKKIFFIDSRE